MTRVWLSEWEWACCGDPFAVGDRVEFGIESRTPGDSLVEFIGRELAQTVDAMESHHEDAVLDNVTGVVRAVNAVTRDVVERRILRRPAMGAPPDAAAPAEGEAWSAGRMPIGTTAYASTQPSRSVLVHEPVPGAAMLHPVRGVRIERDEAEEAVEQMLADVDTEPPAEHRTRQYLGWVVEIDEDDSLV